MHALIDLKTRPMTEDEVLAVLRDMHRHWSAEDGDPDATIDYQTSVNDWCLASGIDTWMGGNPVAAWTDLFRVQFSPRQWAQVVKPGRKRTLREVCELIASRARVEEVEPVSWFGKPCMPAGVFLAIRTFLARGGADIRELRPSTPLNRYIDARAYPRFFYDLMRIAPGRIPALHFIRPRCEGSLLRVLLACFVVGFNSSNLTKFTDIAAFVLVTAIVTGIVAMVGFYISNRRPALRVECGTLHDFGDLARAIAGEANFPSQSLGASR